jgi:hypothetical protein
MSIICTKPLPIFNIVCPDGSRSVLPATAGLQKLMAYDHVVECTVDSIPMRMHHWDCRSKGAEQNTVGTNILGHPGVTQKKGQKRKTAYGFVWVMVLQEYPCVRVERSAADLRAALKTYLPDMVTYEAVVSTDVWDVYFWTRMSQSRSCSRLLWSWVNKPVVITRQRMKLRILQPTCDDK